MIKTSDIALVRYELAGYLRGPLPYRFLPLVPAGVFLAVWSWNLSSPFAVASWIVLVALEPRVNNIFFCSPGELERLSLLPVDFKRVIIVKNLSTVFIAAYAQLVVSAVFLYFSPGVMVVENVRAAGLYFITVCFPLLSFGNEASVRSPRRRPDGFPGGAYEAVWISLTYLALSIPYILITDLFELPWLCLPYGVATMLTWYYLSVGRTVREIMNRSNSLWEKPNTPLNS